MQGVQGTLKTEPLTLLHGDERLTLRFECKPCEILGGGLDAQERAAAGAARREGLAPDVAADSLLQDEGRRSGLSPT